MALLHIRSCNSSEPQYSQYIKIFSKIAVSLPSLAFVDGCMWRLNVIVLLTLVWVSVSVKAEGPDNVGNEKHKQHAKHEKLSKKHTHEVDEHTSSQSKSDFSPILMNSIDQLFESFMPTKSAVVIVRQD
jgi:hypothetical protein